MLYIVLSTALQYGRHQMMTWMPLEPNIEQPSAPSPSHQATQGIVALQTTLPSPVVAPPCPCPCHCQFVLRLLRLHLVLLSLRFVSFVSFLSFVLSLPLLRRIWRLPAHTLTRSQAGWHTHEATSMYCTSMYGYTQS